MLQDAKARWAEAYPVADHLLGNLVGANGGPSWGPPARGALSSGRVPRHPRLLATLTFGSTVAAPRSMLLQPFRRRFGVKIVTWLILPVVICLSQRLSHACLSISNYTVKLRMAH